jgi:hypothetical protein
MLVLGLCRIMMQDLNLVLTSFQAASEEIMQWSNDRAAATTASIGLGMTLDKTKKVLLLVMNRSIAEKFNETLIESEFVLEAVSSVAECEEECSRSYSSPPVFALAVPMSSPESHHIAIKELAVRLGIGAVVSIPKNILTALRELA